MIPTRTLQNRAVHGDTVAVRLLTPEDPEEEEEGEAGREGEVEGEGDERGSDEAVGAGGTGREWAQDGGSMKEEEDVGAASVLEGEVVGIVNRPERDLVVALVDDVLEPGAPRDASRLRRGLSSSGSSRERSWGRDRSWERDLSGGSGLDESWERERSGGSGRAQGWERERSGGSGRDQGWERDRSGGSWSGPGEEGGVGAEWGPGEGDGGLAGGHNMRSYSSNSST